jgi:hypothetical protein
VIIGIAAGRIGAAIMFASMHALEQGAAAKS